MHRTEDVVKNKKLTAWSIALLVIGMIGSLADWISYPVLRMKIYGYQGDGWLFFIVFVMLILLLVSSRGKLRSRSYIWSFSILSGGMAWLASNKIFEIQNQISSFESDDPYLITAASGAKLSYGLPLVLLGAVGILVTIGIQIYSGKKKSK